MQLIAPQHVKAYVTGNKNDFIDAEAICEDASRLRARSVPVKSVEQQVLSIVYKLHKSSVSRRNGVIRHLTGGKSTLLGISKHGDRYLRALLIQGAQTALYRIDTLGA